MEEVEAFEDITIDDLAQGFNVNCVCYSIRILIFSLPARRTPRVFAEIRRTILHPRAPGRANLVPPRPHQLGPSL